MRSKQRLVIQGLITLIVIFCVYGLLRTNEGKLWTRETNQTICTTDIVTGQQKCRPSCSLGYFSLPGMQYCRPWLTCADKITDVKEIGHGHVKKVVKAVWNDYEVAHLYLRDQGRLKDFEQGMNHLRLFYRSRKVVQFIGSCGHSYVTELHPLGSADQLDSLLKKEPYTAFNTAKTRLQACISYAEGIRFLHNSPIGTRLMCSSNYPEKALSQFLLNSELDLILNDVDRIPEVSSKYGVKVLCLKVKIKKDEDTFAPEQRWPFGDEKFDKKKMPGYDEKSDVWKIPNACDHLLGSEGSHLKKNMSAINEQCRQEKPDMRPSASEVVDVYTKLLENLN